MTLDQLLEQFEKATETLRYITHETRVKKEIYWLRTHFTEMVKEACKDEKLPPGIMKWRRISLETVQTGDLLAAFDSGVDQTRAEILQTLGISK